MSDELLSPDQFNPRILFIFRRVNTYRDVPESHSHDYISIIYIIHGEGAYECNGVIYPACSGSLFIINPDVTHHRILTGEQKMEEFHMSISSFRLKGMPENFLLPPDDMPTFTLMQHKDAFLHCVDEMEAEQKRNDIGSSLMLKCLVMKMMVLIMKERYNKSGCKPNEGYNDLHDKWAIAAHVTAFLDHNYMREVSLASLSETAYLSPVYVSRIFKEVKGESPIQYLIRVRMAKACDLLQQNELTIGQIASAVSYHDAFHFSKLFKKYYGLSPSEYRAR